MVGGGGVLIEQSQAAPDLAELADTVRGNPVTAPPHEIMSLRLCLKRIGDCVFKLVDCTYTIALFASRQRRHMPVHSGRPLSC